MNLQLLDLYAQDIFLYNSYHNVDILGLKIQELDFTYLWIVNKFNKSSKFDQKKKIINNNKSLQNGNQLFMRIKCQRIKIWRILFINIMKKCHFIINFKKTMRNFNKKAKKISIIKKQAIYLRWANLHIHKWRDN